MKSFAFLTTVFAFNITEPKSLRGRKQETSAEFIDRLLVGYDSNVHPNYYSKKPTNISVNIYINSIDSVESSTMDYKGITNLKDFNNTVGTPNKGTPNKGIFPYLTRNLENGK